MSTRWGYIMGGALVAIGLMILLVAIVAGVRLRRQRRREKIYQSIPTRGTTIWGP